MTLSSVAVRSAAALFPADKLINDPGYLIRVKRFSQNGHPPITRLDFFRRKYCANNKGDALSDKSIDQPPACSIIKKIVDDGDIDLGGGREL